MDTALTSSMGALNGLDLALWAGCAVAVVRVLNWAYAKQPEPQLPPQTLEQPQVTEQPPQLKLAV